MLEIVRGTALLFTLACLLAAPAAAGGTQPMGAATSPPQIYEVLTTPFCARIHDRLRPAVATILENDRTIAKSAPLFHRYLRGSLAAGAGSAQAEDSIDVESPETQMALQQMSYLVSPIAQNLLAAQKMLGDAELVKPTGNPGDDRRLARMKQQLLETLAFQSASLDLINGFVTTQQMGELQHAGEEYVAAIQSSGSTAVMVHQTPGPLQDPNAPGLAPNPYAVDLAAVPGLAVGYNPLTRIVDGLHWLQTETTKRENGAAASITAALAECNK